MAHKLSLSIQDAVNDNKFILVNDLSIYDQVLGVHQRVLQVLPPYLDEWVRLSMPQSAHIAISSIDISGSSELEDLPDGPYRFHFSVAPNSQMFLIKPFYRTAILMNQVLSQMVHVAGNCTAYVDECGNMTFTKNQNMLLHIWMLLQGVAAMGTNEFGYPKVQELYTQASRAFTKLTSMPGYKLC